MSENPEVVAVESQIDRNDMNVALGYFWGRYDALPNKANLPPWATCEAQEFAAFFVERCGGRWSQLGRLFDEFVASKSKPDTAVTS